MKTKPWITEIGYPTHRTSRRQRRAVQARDCVRTLALLHRCAGLGRSFWYDFKDDGLTDYNEHNFGLVHHQQFNCAPKPGIVAMSVLIRTPPPNAFRCSGKAMSISPVTAGADQRHVLVVWTTDQPRSLRLTICRRQPTTCWVPGVRLLAKLKSLVHRSISLDLNWTSRRRRSLNFRDRVDSGVDTIEQIAVSGVAWAVSGFDSSWAPTNAAVTAACERTQPMDSCEIVLPLFLRCVPIDPTTVAFVQMGGLERSDNSAANPAEKNVAAADLAGQQTFHPRPKTRKPRNSARDSWNQIMQAVLLHQIQRTLHSRQSTIEANWLN